MDLRNNLGLKVVALFLALAAWVYVHSQSDIQRALVVPLDLGDLPREFIEVSNASLDVTVHLRGPETFLSGIGPERVRIAAGLARQPLKVGANRIPLDATMVRMPAGLTIERINPGFVELQLDRRITKEVAVLPAVQGQPAPGFEVVDTPVIPPRVMVEGPEQALSEIESISTQSVPIEAINETRRMSVRPLVVGADPTLVSLVNRQQTVEVLVRVQPLQDERTFAGVALQAAGGGRQPLFSPVTVTVRARGPRDKVAALTGADLLAVADLAGRGGPSLEINPAALRIVAAPGSGVDLAGLDLEVTGPALLRATWPQEGGS